MLNKIITLTIIIAFTLTFLQNCDTTEPPSNRSISLIYEDASSTETWLNLKTENIPLPQQVNLLQNNTLRYSINLTLSDTTFYIDSLLPNQTYKFQTIIQSTNQKSNSISITTMDTTSHNFTWETLTFGGVNGSSYLKDVAIINENNIWAVGEIHTAETDQFDSNGVWVKPYNAVHWNGQKWELKRIMFYTFCNQGHKAPYEARAIFHFSDDITAITSGSQITYLENGIQKRIDCIPVSVNSIWGTSSKDFYVVGQGGNIAHYNGSSWEKIESRTKTQIRDIWGYVDKVTGEKKILCAVSNVITLGDNKILEIKENNTVSEVSWNTDYADKRVNALWFNDCHQIFTCGGGVFKSRSKKLWKKQPLPAIHTNKIRGKGKNDIFVVGDFGLLAHFNGVSWKVYNTKDVALFYSLNYNKNILTAVGQRNGKAVIVMMRKQ